MLFVALACPISVSSFAAETSSEPNSETISRLSSRFRVAKNQYERRLVCIEAIDQGLIASGKDVQIVKEIFGTPSGFEKLRPGETSVVPVFFNVEQIMRESKPNATAALSGWYFFCKYDSEMQIVKYYVTNAPYKTPI